MHTYTYHRFARILHIFRHIFFSFRDLFWTNNSKTDLLVWFGLDFYRTLWRSLELFYVVNFIIDDNKNKVKFQEMDNKKKK